MKAKWKTSISEHGVLAFRCQNCGKRVKDQSKLDCACNKDRVLKFGEAPRTEQPHHFKCSGGRVAVTNDPMFYHPDQELWMLANKPLYYTGRLRLDIIHLPPHLRHL